MATTNSTPITATGGSQPAAALTYQQSMQDLNAIVIANPSESSVVTLQPNTLTTVTMQAGKHFKVRKISNDGVTSQTPDNVVAVRHGDSLHVRYADGSVVNFDEFYSNCTDSSVCSVTLPSDNGTGITLSAADAVGGAVADDGLLVYAHGDPDVLMAMAQDQPTLLSAVLALGNGATVTYGPADSHLGVFALAALAVAAVANSDATSGNRAAPLTASPVNAGQSAALAKISTAAQTNSATDIVPDASVYAAAGVTGVNAANLASINSALDSAAIDGTAANTPEKLQAIVDAYSAILASADGRSSNTATALTGAQYAAIGVTGVTGTAAPGTALSLLDSAVDGSTTAAVNKEDEVQAMANAAAHVIAAAGTTATVSLADLTALGVGGVTAGNLATIQAAIQAAKPNDVDTQPELQHLVNTKLGTIGVSLNAIADAAEANTATSNGLKTNIYADANVTGVTADNLAAINSALDSTAVNGAAADTTAEVQGIVNAYNAILASADGKAGNTTTPLTGAQYAEIGVTGVSGTSAPGTALKLLDSTVDGRTAAAVDTEGELQSMADAAAHVIAAAGGTTTQAAAVTLPDLTALGIAGVSPANLAAVQKAIQAAAPTTVDTQDHLQGVVNNALGAPGSALNAIAAAAEMNSATSTTPDLSVYSAAGVTVATDLLPSLNSALDSAVVNGAAADTTAEVQAIADAYTAILNAAKSSVPSAAPAPSSEQYATVGVSGVTGTRNAGSVVYLLDDALVGIGAAKADTVPELQVLADAASHVIAAAGGGSVTQAAALTVDDLANLGISGVTGANLASIRSAIQGVADTAVATKSQLQSVVDAAISAGAAPALATIRDDAQNNTAASSQLAAATYLAAGVTGVDTAGNLAAINSALDSPAVTGPLATTAVQVQAIVDAYNAILSAADGQSNGNGLSLTGAQYAAIGVTGVSGVATAGNALFLLDNVVDGKLRIDVDSQLEVQALANAANHMLDAAGGTPGQIAALTLNDLKALGVTGVTADLLPAVIAAIGKVTPDTGVDTLGEVQTVVTAAVNAATTALGVISGAAQSDNAQNNFPALTDYVAAGVTGVSSGNQLALNSALDSAAVNGAAADTAGEVQGIVNAYNAILNAADSQSNGNGLSLTGAQYTAIGVTGLSGTSAPGTPLQLVDSVVDVSAPAAVDTVSELQALANAAAHVFTGAAGGTAPTLAELQTLGVTGVDSTNLGAVQAAIAATADNGTGVDTLSALQLVADSAINSHPVLSSALAGVTNLDVTSDLVLSANQSVKIGTGFIHITDLGGSNGGTGYQNDTNTNTQTIDVAQAIQSGLLTISGTGANAKIVINPAFDLDLSSNYQLTIDDGAFLNASGAQSALHFAAVNFSTVTPGVHTTGTASSEAVASQTMNDNTGALMASKSWLDIQGLSNITGSVVQLGDLSTGAYALVMKNYATARGGDPLLGGNTSDGIATHDTNVGVTNFGANDIVYFDAQLNDPSKQFFDGRITSMTDGGDVGGLKGQNGLVMGLVSVPQQQGSNANILLGLEGNTSNTIYAAIYSLSDGTVGWADTFHFTAPVVMG